MRRATTLHNQEGTRTMNNSTFKNSAIAAVAALSIAGFATVASTQTASAGNNFWNGVAAGAVGTLVVGGIIHNSHRNHNHGHTSNWNAHVDWCYDHRPRYRQSDNTYRRNGQNRRICDSPYSY